MARQRQTRDNSGTCGVLSPLPSPLNPQPPWAQLEGSKSVTCLARGLEFASLGHEMTRTFLPLCSASPLFWSSVVRWSHFLQVPHSLF